MHFYLTIPSPMYLNVNLPSRGNIVKPEKEMDVLSPLEQEKLMRVLRTLEYPAYGAIALMLELGLRSGEAQTIMWNDVLMDRRAVKIHRTLVRLSSETGITFVQDSAKSKTSNRIVPLSRSAIDIFEQIRCKDCRQDGYVFPSVIERNIPISYCTVKYAMKQACEKAGIRYRSVHMLRHTFATNCYTRGCDVKILSKLFGHADVGITYNFYIHLYGDALEEMRKIID